MDIRRSALINAFILVDILNISSWICILLSNLMLNRPYTIFGLFQTQTTIWHFILGVGYLIFCQKVLSSFKLYNSRRLSTLQVESIDVFFAYSICSIILYTIALLFEIKTINIKFIFIFWIGTCFTAIVLRIIMRWLLKQIRLKSRNLRRILIVGTNQQAIQFVREIESMPEIGYRLAGFVDEDWAGLDEFKHTKYKIVCSKFAEINDYLRKNIVDEVAIFLPMKSNYSTMSGIIKVCEKHGVIVRNQIKVFDSKAGNCQVYEFFGNYLVTHYTGCINGWRALIKRVVDILISSSGLIILLPPFILLIPIIKINSKGPALFVQDRVGINKRIFKLYKFRTMVVDAEKELEKMENMNEVSGPVFKIKNDPRITTIGKFLRRTSIDELPQLINVLKGEMSIVGPRPLPVRDYRGFNTDWHRRRFSVKPGITCLWQVNGRSEIPFEQWMELDMDYIDKWSLLLDFKIMIKTIPAVFKGLGAA